MLTRTSLIKELDDHKYDDASTTLNRIKNILLTSIVEPNENFISVGRREELLSYFITTE